MNNTVLEMLKRMELKGAAESYAAMMQEPSLAEGLSTDELMLLLLEAEENKRFLSKQHYLLNNSKIPSPALLKDILYTQERGIELRTNVAKLATMDFIREGKNLNLFGPTASGKSFLTCALARKACQSGYSAIYYSTKDLIAELLLLKGTAAYRNKRKSLLGKALLCLDDFCLTTYNTEEQAVLFDVLNDRFERKSTLIASQKSPLMWAKEMGGSTLAEAIISRAAHNNYQITLKGDSLRRSFDINSGDEIVNSQDNTCNTCYTSNIKNENSEEK